MKFQMLSALKKLAESDPTFIDFFTFVGSDSWGSKQTPIRGVEQYARGAITLAPNQQKDDGFTEHFEQMNPQNVPRENIWFDEFWHNSSGCTNNDANVAECLQRQGQTFTQVD